MKICSREIAVLDCLFMHDVQKVTEENFEAWNEEMVRRYKTVLDNPSIGFVQRFIELARVRTVIKLLDVRETDEVLDVGCGAGNILENIRKGQLVGLDLSETLLAIAQKRLGSRARLVKGNAEDMVKLFPGEVFSKIFSSEVLEHVLNPGKVIEQIHTLLRADGVLVVSIPYERLIKAIKRTLIIFGLFRFFFPKYKKIQTAYEWHLHDFDLNMLRKIIGGRFLIQKVKGVPFWFLPLRYVILLKPVGKT
jgi:2-polyprenyl-3-methyl-5-hydroxy-6-metoxy-1,4-benzoquinol methylase